MEFDNIIKKILMEVKEKLTDTQLSDIEVAYKSIMGRNRYTKKQFKDIINNDFESIFYYLKYSWFDPTNSEILTKTKKQLLKLNSGQKRVKTGQWAEDLLVKKYKWVDKKKNPQDTKKIVLKLTVPSETTKGTKLKQVTISDILENIDDDLFINSLIINKDLNKYDLLVNINGEKEKLEVKKYSDRQVIGKKIMFAEQKSIKTKEQLISVVKTYNKVTNDNLFVDELKDRNLISEIFNRKEDGTEKIIKFYNDGIESFYQKLMDRGEELDVQKDVYGIYFFNKESGKDGFLIKNFNEDGTSIINYKWEFVSGHWGFNRLTIFSYIPREVKKWVWNGNNFIEKDLAINFDESTGFWV